MKNVYQVVQVWEDNGDEFLMGTYLTRIRADQEKRLLEDKESGKYEYVVKPVEVKE